MNILLFTLVAHQAKLSYMNRKQKVTLNKTKILIQLEFLRVPRTAAQVSPCYRSIVAREVDPHRDNKDGTRVDVEGLEIWAEDDQNRSSSAFI